MDITAGRLLDQLYADSIWDKVSALEGWAKLNVSGQVKQKPTGIPGRHGQDDHSFG